MSNDTTHVTVTRTIDSAAKDIFAVLTLPARHHEFDGSGMVRNADDVQLADIYTADPAIAENDLVVLEDPESMILPQNVVPVVSEKVDDAAAEAIDAVLAQLSADDLVELNRQSVVDQASSAEIATGWLTEKGLV